MENNILLTKISAVINEIENKFPEVYKHLDEIPQTIPSQENPEVHNKQMEHYLFSLETMLKKAKKTPK